MIALCLFLRPSQSSAVPADQSSQSLGRRQVLAVFTSSSSVRPTVLQRYGPGHSSSACSAVAPDRPGLLDRRRLAACSMDSGRFTQADDTVVNTQNDRVVDRARVWRGWECCGCSHCQERAAFESPPAPLPLIDVRPSPANVLMWRQRQSRPCRARSAVWCWSG
jgi:hypothetical protein